MKRWMELSLVDRTLRIDVAKWIAYSGCFDVHNAIPFKIQINYLLLYSRLPNNWNETNIVW